MYRTTSPSFLGSSASTANTIWLIVSIILAIIGGILVYVLFLSKKNEGKFSGFLGWLYDFLKFKKMFIEILLKVTYLISAIFITLSSFSFISVSFLTFLLYLVLGNILIRVCYEFSLILLVICNNTTEINKKLTTTEKKDN